MSAFAGRGLRFQQAEVMILDSLYIYSRAAKSRSSVRGRLFRESGDFACCSHGRIVLGRNPLDQCGLIANGAAAATLCRVSPPAVSCNSIAVASRGLSFVDLEQPSEYLRKRTLFLTKSDARLGLRARVDGAGTMPDRRPLPRRVSHGSAVADNHAPASIRSSAGRRALFRSIRWCKRIITQRLQY